LRDVAGRSTLYPMTESEMRRFLEGLLTAWSVEGEASAAAIPDGVSGRISRPGLHEIAVTRRCLPFGVAWEVGAAGARTRAHPSSGGAIRSLGALLAPERARGRVVFAAAEDGAP